jgi:hypothetical protein
MGWQSSSADGRRNPLSERWAIVIRLSDLDLKSLKSRRRCFRCGYSAFGLRIQTKTEYDNIPNASPHTVGTSTRDSHRWWKSSRLTPADPAATDAAEISAKALYLVSRITKAAFIGRSQVTKARQRRLATHVDFSYEMRLIAGKIMPRIRCRLEEMVRHKPRI